MFYQLVIKCMKLSARSSEIPQLNSLLYIALIVFIDFLWIYWLKFSFIINPKYLFILKSNCLLIHIQIINREHFGNSTKHTGNRVGASLVAQRKESACQCRRCRFNPWVRKIPWRRKWQPSPVFLPGKFYRKEEPGRSTVLQRVRHDLVTKWQQYKLTSWFFSTY